MFCSSKSYAYEWLDSLSLMYILQQQRADRLVLSTSRKRRRSPIAVEGQRKKREKERTIERAAGDEKREQQMKR